jgi:hypothetical protein
MANTIIMADRRGSVTSVVGGELRKMSVASFALEAAVLPSTQSAAFDTDSVLEEHYKPIESYEDYHRYHPKYTWSHEEENCAEGLCNYLSISSITTYLVTDR